MKLKAKIYKLFFEKNISVIKKHKFKFFGKNSIIKKPYLQLSGVQGISIGNNVTVLENSRIAVYGEIKDNVISIGDGSYICFGFTALAQSDSNLIIGSNVLIASNVLITNENHGINPELSIPYMYQEINSKNVNIGDGCWIGENVCILQGVTIGKYSIVGAGSIVTKSIPDYSIAVGNPAKIIKMYNFQNKRWESVNEKE